MAFPTGYTKYQNVTIDKDRVDATLTDFPVFLDLSEFDTTTDIFGTCRSDGGDIRITLSNGTTQLAREIVSIDTTGKTGEIHVKIPSLSSSVDTVIRVWYNGTDTEPAEDSTYGKENTWNSDYAMVQHMQDSTTSTIIGSTANSVSGTKTSADNPIEAAGIIGSKSQDFDGSDSISLGTDTRPTTAMTASAWIKADTLTNHDAIVGDTDFSTLGGGWLLEFYSNQLHFYIASWNLNFAYKAFTDLSDDHYVVGTFDKTAGANALNIYVDSDIGTPDTYTASIPYTGADGLYIGRGFNDGSNSWDGKIDEIRVKDVADSVDWISTEYNNQSSPSTFYSVSVEQGGSTVLPIKLTFNTDEISKGVGPTTAAQLGGVLVGG